MKLRKSPQTALVFREFMRSARDWQYGYDISRNTGLKSGTLYPILMRLFERDLLETRWETSEPGKPPRHMYRLTPGGLKYARQEVTSITEPSHLRAAFDGAKN